MCGGDQCVNSFLSTERGLLDAGEHAESSRSISFKTWRSFMGQPKSKGDHPFKRI